MPGGAHCSGGAFPRLEAEWRERHGGAGVRRGTPAPRRLAKYK